MADNDRTRQLHEQLETQLEQLVSSQDWADMLTVASRFHRYSMRNVMLILCQRPTATRVAGYKTWQGLGRQVRKGEKGIAVLAPCTYKRESEDGEEVRVLRGFKVEHVFDLAQTDGDTIVEVAPVLLDGEAPEGLWDSVAKQIAAAGFMLARGDCGGANGLTNWADRTVTVRADVSDAQACKTLVHELAHVMLHEGSVVCRGVKEVEAESVAYIVAAACGLPTDGYSLPYVARWADGDMAKVKETAEKVIRCAHSILEGIEQVQEVAA